MTDDSALGSCDPAAKVEGAAALVFNSFRRVEDWVRHRLLPESKGFEVGPQVRGGDQATCECSCPKEQRRRNVLMTSCSIGESAPQRPRDRVQQHSFRHGLDLVLSYAAVSSLSITKVSNLSHNHWQQTTAEIVSDFYRKDGQR